MSAYDKINPEARIILKGNEKLFGPGIAMLLHHISDTGSIQNACEKMGMSYTKAWKIIKRLEKEVGFNILESKIGGVKGGSSVMTKEAEELLTKYDIMVKETNEYVDMLYHKHFKR